MFISMTCSLHDRDHSRDLGHVPCAMFLTNLVAKVKLMIMKNKLMAMANNQSHDNGKVHDNYQAHDHEQVHNSVHGHMVMTSLKSTFSTGTTI
jgi:hypothetical protein